MPGDLAGSLRWYDPDQVRRVTGGFPFSAPPRRTPAGFHSTPKGALADRLRADAGRSTSPSRGTVEALDRVHDVPPRLCVVVNGSAAEPSTPLAEGDRVQIFPPTAGG
jgi:molybdopterin converting factor small subunit